MLVAHGLGGLLVKKAVMMARWATPGMRVAFFGTPESHVDASDWQGLTESQDLKDVIRVWCASCVSVHEAFLAMGVPALRFVEMAATNGRVLVPQGSYDTNVQPVPGANHHSISRPDTVNSPVYRAFVDFVEPLAQAAL